MEKMHTYNRRLIGKISPYSMYVLLLLVTWNRETLFQYVKSIIWRIPILTYATQIMVYGFFGFLICISWPYMKKHIRLRDYAFYLLFVLIYVFSILFGIGSSEYLKDNAVLILIQIVPAYFVGLSINYHDEKVFRYIYITSIISVYLHIINAYVSGVENINSTMDSMDFAYRILPHICIVMYAFLTRRRLIDLITSAIGIICLIWFGSRGALLLFFAFAITYYTFFRERRHRFVVYILMFVLFLALSYYSDIIFVLIRNLLLRFGIKTRIFDRIIDQTFFQSVGRSNISEILLENIKSHPWIGLGMAGDRPLCYLVGEVYAHSLPLELWVSYGLIIGTGLLLGYVINIIKAIKRSKGNQIQVLILVYCFSAAFLKLFLSSSYLVEYEFFFNLGICLAVIRNSYNSNEVI